MRRLRIKQNFYKFFFLSLLAVGITLSIFLTFEPAMINGILLVQHVFLFGMFGWGPFQRMAGIHSAGYEKNAYKIRRIHETSRNDKLHLLQKKIKTRENTYSRNWC